MKRTNALLAILALSALPLGAIDWPSDTGQLESNFGDGTPSGPSVQLDFSGDTTVRAADAGQLFFAADAASEVNGFPSPLGSWIAVDHGDGLFSVYGHLESGASGAYKTMVEKGSVLSRSGKSGYTDQTGYSFSVYDREERRWVNPVMIAKQREDKRPPVIRSVMLTNASGQTINVTQNRNVRQGAYRLSVDAGDGETSSGGAPLVPLQIICGVNGQEQKAFYLDTLAVRDGRLRLSGMPQLDAATIYAAWPALDMGEIRLNRGRSSLEVMVRDASGNSRSITYILSVE